jgi:hypothetical protein
MKQGAVGVSRIVLRLNMHHVGRLAFVVYQKYASLREPREYIIITISHNHIIQNVFNLRSQYSKLLQSNSQC